MRPYPHRMSPRMFVAGLASTPVLATAMAMVQGGDADRMLVMGHSAGVMT